MKVHSNSSHPKRSLQFPGILFAFICTSFVSHAENLAIRADVIHTMAGPFIKEGTILVKEGKIAAVGNANTTSIPEGYKVLTAKVATPGFIDAHTVVGFSGILNQPHDQEQLDRSGPVQPELRAVDAYNALDPLVSYIRGFGVTTIHTGHGTGALVSGQTMIVKTYPSNLEQAVINPAAMTAITLGVGATPDRNKAPGTASKAVAMLRAELIKAQDYRRKTANPDPEKRPSRDLRLETLVRALDGSQPFLVTVHRHQDIRAALRLAREFDLNIVLDGVADAHLMLDSIKASAFPIILHPTMARASGELENLSLETAASLNKSGILFALQSGFEAYVPKTRVVLFEAALAVANGLSHDRALAAITIQAARTLRIENRVGSIEPGKDADIALFDGDPFEYTTHCTTVIVQGTVADSQSK